ncbi:hypothetical protein [Streptomyces sp. NPDC005486]|uniref:hypothetical protein n=1 Tax=Streptomyces sp. NPDC005486 TaxID=3155345 RepID=UPI0033A52E09
MKPLLLGAVLALLWLVFGLSVTVVSSLLQPVTVAFAAGLLARPHLTRPRWTR